MNGTKGRPLKLTPARQKTLCEALVIGMTLKGACGRAGISDQTFLNWRNAGQAAAAKRENGDELSKDEQTYLRFWEATEAAEAEAEAMMTSAIYEAMQTDPNYARWWLERRRPGEYGPRNAVQVGGPDVGGVEIVVRFVAAGQQVLAAAGNDEQHKADR